MMACNPSPLNSRLNVPGNGPNEVIVNQTNFSVSFGTNFSVTTERPRNESHENTQVSATIQFVSDLFPVLSPQLVIRPVNGGRFIVLDSKFTSGRPIEVDGVIWNIFHLDGVVSRALIPDNYDLFIQNFDTNQEER